MTEHTGFNLLGNNKAQVLILGSMPSVVSLAKQQYYGHPRNTFWQIMAALFNADKPIAYPQANRLLEAQGIAVWDVLKSCAREGSLDSAIEASSIEINDFARLFDLFCNIEQVFFNGSTAQALYNKHIYPNLLAKYKALNYTRLPSTSPAYAAMPYQDKLVAWSVVKVSCKGGL